MVSAGNVNARNRNGSVDDDGILFAVARQKALFCFRIVVRCGGGVQADGGDLLRFSGTDADFVLQNVGQAAEKHYCFRVGRVNRIFDS